MRLKPILLAVGGLSLVPIFALAQEKGPQTPRFTLDVDQRFGAGDNPGLEVPSQGSYLLSNTQLLFGMSSETEIQKIDLKFGGSLRLGQSPPEIDTGFKSPLIDLKYARKVANSSLSFGTGYEERDISFLRASDFIDENGKLDLPEDSDDLTGSGTRYLSHLNVALETGINDPIGFIFKAQTRTTNYENATSARLEDYQRASAGVTALLRFSEVTTGKVALSYRTYDTDNTERDDRSIRLGVSHAFSATTQLNANFGYKETDSNDFGSSTITGGRVYDLALIRDMPNGTAEFTLDSNRDYLGERLRARASRSMELPTGSLSYSVGATTLNGENPNFIGYLNWERDLPDGDINLSLNQDVGYNSADDERLYTTAFLEYRHEITENSGVGFGALYSLSDYGDSGRVVERSNITAAYRHGLPSDWNLIVGASYRVRDESFIGRANSGSVFINLARSFEFLN